MYRTGFTDINVEVPVLRRLGSLNFFSLFLGLIMSIIVVVLAFLSITLVYSLLMINVETRTFEMGVMRMVGLQRDMLVQLLMTQAMLYAVPGFVLGIVVAQVRPWCWSPELLLMLVFLVNCSACLGAHGRGGAGLRQSGRCDNPRVAAAGGSRHRVRAGCT